MQKYNVVPLWLDGDELVIACTEPSNQRKVREIAIAARRPIKPMLASIIDIRQKLNLILGSGRKALPLPDFGESLYLLGHLSEAELHELRQARLNGENDWRFITENHLVGEDGLTEAVGWSQGKPYLTRQTLSTEPCLTPLIPWDLVNENKNIPLWWFNGALILGASASGSGEIYDVPNQRVGFPTWTVVVAPSTWNNYYRKTYLHGKSYQGDDPNALIEILFESGRLSALDRDSVEVVVQQTGLPLDEILLERELITRKSWLEARAKLYGVALAKKERSKDVPAQELSRLIPDVMARSFSAVPLRRDNGKVVVGMYTPVPEIIGMLKSLTGLDIVPEMMDIVDIQKEIDFDLSEGTSVRRTRIAWF